MSEKQTPQDFPGSGAGEAILFLGFDGEAFAGTHRVITPARDAADTAGSLGDLLDAHGVAAVNIVAAAGHTQAAVVFAGAHPQRVKRLVLVEPTAVPATPHPVLCPVLMLGEPKVPPGFVRARAAERQDVAAQIAAFLQERLSPFDNRELRAAFGSFMTGVTIVTTIGPDGALRGFTANSFTSVSLEPPLLLICIGKQAASMEVFRKARGFAVNILSEAQKDTSVLFASKRADKFEATAWRAGPFGNPLIEGAAAWFDCARYQVIDAGDHIILMGQVEGFSYSDANPLGYARGHYITLGLEQAAVNAASSASRTVVGAILENDNRLILLPDAARPNGLTLPEVGRQGPSGSASQLHGLLQREAMDATLGFLFAVFENPGTHEQCIYYRGEALLHARGRTVLADFDDIPWDRLPDESSRSMLRRYAAERKIGRFKVYSGDHRQGTVKAVD